MVCSDAGSGGECPVCRLRDALTVALSCKESGAAVEIVELLLDAVAATRDCYGGGDADAAADAASLLASLSADLEDVAGLGGDREAAE